MQCIVKGNFCERLAESVTYIDVEAILLTVKFSRLVIMATTHIFIIYGNIKKMARRGAITVNNCYRYIHFFNIATR